jgi:hypothetical protein
MTARPNYSNVSPSAFEKFREWDRLEAEHAYRITDADGESWAWSPDGIGCYWYDTREELEAQHGSLDATESLTTAELQADYRVLGFAAPYVVVERKSDGVKGTFTFDHSPRVYFDWKEDN